MMTPLHIRIALHYYILSTTIPYAENESAHRYSSATREYTQHLVAAMASWSAWDDYAEYTGHLKALGVYVEALCSVPWPVLRWVIPNAFDPSAPQS